MSILNVLGIANAYAATTTTSTREGLVSMLPMFIILIGLMYFLIIRPQTKRTKEHQALVSGLKAGDEVVTNGGLLGKLVKVGDSFVTLKLAENVVITAQKQAIASVVPKGTMGSM